MDDLIKENIECRNFEVTNDSIICPYCGYKKSVEYEMYFGENNIDVYEEGEQDVKCPNCGHVFLLTKTLTWEYTTEIKEEER